MSDVRAFRRICHDLARRTNGSVAEFWLASGPTPSFHQGIIAYPHEKVAVVYDRTTPRAAIAEPRTGTIDSSPLTFLDRPTLATALQEVPGPQVLTKAELDTAFKQTDWPEPTKADIKYWRPQTVGEALFHFWD